MKKEKVFERYDQVESAVQLIMAEIERANETYPDRFNSSKEALGVLREEYMEVEEDLRRVKVFGINRTGDTKLKKELVQLAAMCIKTLYSITDIGQRDVEEEERIRAARQQVGNSE